MSNGISKSVWITAHTAVLNQVFTGSNIANIRVLDSDDVILIEQELDSINSYVNAIGDLILIPLVESESMYALESGTADYAQIISAENEVLIQLPCVEGLEYSAGECCLNSLTIVKDSPVTVHNIFLLSEYVMEESS